MYCKAKKFFGAIQKFLKMYFIKKPPKGAISIYADFGPPSYVLLCYGGISHEAQSPTGYRKRTAQILRATHFYDLLM